MFLSFILQPRKNCTARDFCLPRLAMSAARSTDSLDNVALEPRQQGSGKSALAATDFDLHPATLVNVGDRVVDVITSNGRLTASITSSEARCR